MARPFLISLVLLLQFLSTSAWVNLAGLGLTPTSLFKNQPNNNSRRIPPKNVRLLILPGFGNDAIDYYLPQQPQGSLVDNLCKRGWDEQQIRVLPVARSDWLQVFLQGALDWSFWQGNMAPTQPAFKWYLDKVTQQIQDLCATTNAVSDDESSSKSTDPIQVVLLCHSAGGWLARAALGFNSRNDTATIDLSSVLGVVTLGSPHIPPPPDAMDMTRGALRITDQLFPGAYHAASTTSDTATDNNLFYISVMGQAIRGVEQQRSNPWEPTTVTGFAYTSYQAVCGDGSVTGDGVVPVCSGHLEGAQQLNLPNVFHSINAPDQWYGSDAVMDSWHSVMLEQVVAKLAAAPSPTTNKPALNNPLNRLFSK